MELVTTIKYLTEKEKQELYERIEQDTSKHAIRNKAIFYLAKYCALRVSEVGSLNITDFDSNNKQIYCKRKKKSYNNTIRILDKTVLKSLNAWLDIRKTIFPESNCLFVSQKGTPISRSMLDTLMKSYSKGTNIRQDHRHFHVLKHTRAIELGNARLDIKDIQWWLGHKSIMNTEIYLQFTTIQQEHMYKKLKGERKSKNGKKKN